MSNGFIHADLINLGYHDLKCNTAESGRIYETPDGKCYPSITTVLGSLNKESIKKWRESVGKETADRITHHACTRGTALHEAIERYLNNEKNYFIKNEMPHVKYLFNSVKPVLDKYIGKIYMQEVPLYSDHLGVAGRVDCIAEFDGKLSIIDFKTARRAKRKEHISNYFMQATAYAIMFEERTGIPITNSVIIMAVDDSPTPIIFKEKRDHFVKPLLDTIKNFK